MQELNSALILIQKYTMISVTANLLNYMSFMSKSQKALIAFIFIILFFAQNTIAANSNQQSEDFWNKNNVHKPENYIFGYGSLTNSKSREASLGTRSEAIPARISAKFGYTRKWNQRSQTLMTALGLEKGSGSTINGVVYPVSGTDMDIWDARETGYERKLVPWELVQSTGWQGLPSTGKLWIYVSKNAATPDRDFPIVQSYVDVCLLGFLEYGEDFAIEFLKSTEGWSEWWLNDRIMERRPWVYLKEYNVIDKLLKTQLPPKGSTSVFEARKNFAFEEPCIPENRICATGKAK